MGLVGEEKKGYKGSTEQGGDVGGDVEVYINRSGAFPLQC